MSLKKRLIKAFKTSSSILQILKQEPKFSMLSCHTSLARTFTIKNWFPEKRKEAPPVPHSNTVRPYSACNIDKRMLQYGIVPDVIKVAPRKECVVLFDDGAQVCRGNILTPKQVKYQPYIRWEVEKDAYYTLCMTDPDAPSRADPKFREWHHWLVINIHENNIDEATTLSAYIGSGPPRDSGFHRYIYLIYKQPKGKMKWNEKELDATSAKGRANFKISKFAHKYDLGDPVAGNFYLAEYDDYVPKLYAKLSGRKH